MTTGQLSNGYNWGGGKGLFNPVITDPTDQQIIVYDQSSGEWVNENNPNPTPPVSDGVSVIGAGTSGNKFRLPIPAPSATPSTAVLVTLNEYGGLCGPNQGTWLYQTVQTTNATPFPTLIAFTPTPNHVVFARYVVIANYILSDDLQGSFTQDALFCWDGSQLLNNGTTQVLMGSTTGLTVAWQVNGTGVQLSVTGLSTKAIQWSGWCWMFDGGPT